MFLQLVSAVGRRRRHLLFCCLCSLGLGILVLHAGPVHAANGSVGYTYDALGRVTTATYDSGVCVIYTYDANGNRLSQTVNVNTGNTSTWGTGVWGCFQWQ